LVRSNLSVLLAHELCPVVDDDDEYCSSGWNV
jgi:hypothetical protein